MKKFLINILSIIISIVIVIFISYIYFLAYDIWEKLTGTSGVLFCLLSIFIIIIYKEVKRYRKDKNSN